MKAKIAIVIYFPILATIVYLADKGALPESFSFYRKLPIGDAIGHFGLMGIFSLLATIASVNNRLKILHYKIPIGSMIVMLIVVAEEVSQIFLQKRTFSFQDLFADVAGILTFAWLGLRWTKISSSLDSEKTDGRKTCDFK